MVTAWSCLVVACAPITPIPLPDCRRIAVEAGPGPEDVELDAAGPDAPRLIASVQERRVRNADDSFHYEGRIVSIPLPAGRVRPFELVNREAAPFHPHGIYLRSGSPPVLYVINHAGAGDDRIESFAVKGEQLIALRSYRDPRLEHANDLVALGDGDIYVTRMSRYRGFLGAVELLSGARWGSILHARNGIWRPVGPGIAYPNGIAVTEAGDRLLVASARGRGIHVFQRDAHTGTLSEEPDRFIRLGRGVDNLTWEQDGRVLLAARHPRVVALLRHAGSPDVPSPSIVVRVHVADGRVEPVYVNPGDEFSAASVAVAFAGRVYLGQIFNEGILTCGRKLE